VTEIDPAEQWLAVLGITPFLTTGKISLSASVDTSVQRFMPEIRLQLRRFLRSGGPDVEIPELDFRQVADALFEPPPDDEVGARLMNFPDAVVPGIIKAAQRARSYLQQKLPVVRHQTAMTLEYRDPSKHEQARFARCYAVTDDPSLVFKALTAGRLAGDMVDAFAACYPSLYKATEAEVFEAISDVYAGKESPEMPRVKSVALNMLLGRELSKDLAEEIQKAAEKLEEKPEQKRSGAIGKIPDLYASESERAAG